MASVDVPVEVRREVFEAVHIGDVSKLRAAVEKAPTVLRGGWSGGNGATFLHLAASKGRTSVCAVLVELGIDVNEVDQSTGGTPLESAADRGHVDTLKWLLERGARVDGLPTSIATPLMGAAMNGHLNAAQLLVDEDAEINREHLRLPQTALDFAELYRVKGSGQDAVAALLRKRGGIRPYADPHDWSRVPGCGYLELIEHAIGAVNPIELSTADAAGRTVTVRKAAIFPKADYKLLFTVGAAPTAGSELAVPLPWGWPLNRDSLELGRFNWPLRLLGLFAGLAADGERFAHGVIIDTDHPAFKDLGALSGTLQWLMVNHKATDVDRTKEARTLLVLPVTGKKPVTATAARVLADKKAIAKWKTLALPMPEMA
jgi:hypothetical protein